MGVLGGQMTRGWVGAGQEALEQGCCLQGPPSSAKSCPPLMWGRRTFVYVSGTAIWQSKELAEMARNHLSFYFEKINLDSLQKVPSFLREQRSVRNEWLGRFSQVVTLQRK